MERYDLVVIGGGINGAGIARDAAGRGLSVLLAEKHDLGAHTSSASSKLIHGGLRYLERYEFRLVAEALAEREVLMRAAPHLIWPARFIMPHVPELRPRWMIRLGLFLYDHLGRRTTLPGSRSVRLDRLPLASGLKPDIRYGFEYSDCRVDDARLVIANAMSARELGATVLTCTECMAGRRERDLWQVTLQGPQGESQVAARAIVNAAGPWVKRVLNERLAQHSRDSVRLVKGSHIVVSSLYPGNHVYILQNADRRVVFMIPYEDRYTLVGTTDVPFNGDPGRAEASDEEVAYLCRAASRYLARPVAVETVRHRYAGVRPLYDDGSSDPSAVTRDYTLRVDGRHDEPPVLSVFGGKITTYRRLAEQALIKLAPWFPGIRGAWTEHSVLPGGDMRGGGIETFANIDLRRDYPWLPPGLRRGLAHRHGTLTYDVLGSASSLPDLGRDFGAQLYAREIDYLIEREWARSAEDVLWRRTKAGLHLTPAQGETVARYMAGA
jgi:D-erythritol 1-phosphate dehydrogenase